MKRTVILIIASIFLIILFSSCGPWYRGGGYCWDNDDDEHPRYDRRGSSNHPRYGWHYNNYKRNN